MLRKDTRGVHRRARHERQDDDLIRRGAEVLHCRGELLPEAVDVLEERAPAAFVRRATRRVFALPEIDFTARPLHVPRWRGRWMKVDGWPREVRHAVRDRYAKPVRHFIRAQLKQHRPHVNRTAEEPQLWGSHGPGIHDQLRRRVFAGALVAKRDGLDVDPRYGEVARRRETAHRRGA